MKKSMFVLFIMSMAAFAGGTEIKKVHTKTAKLEKDSYCNIPKVYSDFKKINEKDYRVDVDFEKCVLIQNVEKTEKYLKKYKYMHLKAGKNLVYNSNDNSYYYNGSWAFNNDKAYPTVFDGK